MCVYIVLMGDLKGLRFVEAFAQSRALGRHGFVLILKGALSLFINGLPRVHLPLAVAAIQVIPLSSPRFHSEESRSRSG